MPVFGGWVDQTDGLLIEFCATVMDRLYRNSKYTLNFSLAKKVVCGENKFQLSLQFHTVIANFFWTFKRREEERGEKRD